MSARRLFSWIGLILYLGVIIACLYYGLPAIAILLTILAVLALGIDLIWVTLKRKRNKPYQYPSELEEDFNTIERRYTESGGKINPQTILWELAKSKQRGNYRIDQEEPGIRIPSVPEQPYIKRPILQDSFDTGDAIDTTEPPRPQGNYRKGLFGKRRREF